MSVYLCFKCPDNKIIVCCGGFQFVPIHVLQTFLESNEKKRGPEREIERERGTEREGEIDRERESEREGMRARDRERERARKRERKRERER